MGHAVVAVASVPSSVESDHSRGRFVPDIETLLEIPPSGDE